MTSNDINFKQQKSNTSICFKILLTIFVFRYWIRCCYRDPCSWDQLPCPCGKYCKAGAGGGGWGSCGQVAGNLPVSSPWPPWGGGYTSEESLQSVTVTKLLFRVLDSSWSPVEGERGGGRWAPVIRQACKNPSFVARCPGLLANPHTPSSHRLGGSYRAAKWPHLQGTMRDPYLEASIQHLSSVFSPGSGSLTALRNALLLLTLSDRCEERRIKL